MHRNFTEFVSVRAFFCLMIVSQILLGSSALLAEQKTNKQESDNAEKYHLHYQFRAGEFVHYQVSDTSAHTTQKDEIKETAKSQSIAWRQYRVVSVDATGSAVLELLIERVRLQTQFDDHPPIVFDSANPDLQPDRFKHILKTVGKPMSRIRVKQTGELVHVQNFFGGQPQVVKPNKNKEVDPTLNFLVVFPEKPIAIGESWTQTLEVEVPVTKTLKEKVKLLRKYTLHSVKDDKATISLTTALITIIRDPAVKVRLMQQTPSGTIEFDLKHHLLLSRNLKTDDQVIGAFGAGTLVKAMSIRAEKILPASTAKLDKKPASATR